MAYPKDVVATARMLVGSGMTRQGVAEHLGVSPSAVWSWCRDLPCNRVSLPRTKETVLRTALKETRCISAAAKISKVSANTASRWAARLGVRPRRSETTGKAVLLLEQGLPPKAVAAALGVSPVRIRQIRASVPELRTNPVVAIPDERRDQEADLLRRRRERASIPTLVQEFGWSHGAVQRCLERHGLNRLIKDGGIKPKCELSCIP